MIASPIHLSWPQLRLAAVLRERGEQQALAGLLAVFAIERTSSRLNAMGLAAGLREIAPLRSETFFVDLAMEIADCLVLAGAVPVAFLAVVFFTGFTALTGAAFFAAAFLTEIFFAGIAFLTATFFLGATFFAAGFITALFLVAGLVLALTTAFFFAAGLALDLLTALLFAAGFFLTGDFFAGAFVAGADFFCAIGFFTAFFLAGAFATAFLGEAFFLAGDFLAGVFFFALAMGNQGLVNKTKN